MSLSNQLDFEIIYPDGDGQPMAESDPTRDYLIYCVESLNIYFQNRPDVYISGNLFVYYKQGVPDAVVSPDVFVVFGVEKKKRRSYKVWEEGGRVPNFVIEITSKTTQENDEQEKRLKYQRMGVQEYFQYDPTGDYLRPSLKGARLVNYQYQPISQQVADGVVSIYSEVLGLDLRLSDLELRFYNPQTNQRLLSHAETEAARQQAELERQQAELERQHAELGRQQAESERQQAELERQQAEQALQQALRQALQARQEAVPRLLELGLSVEQVAAALNLDVEDIRPFLQE